MGLIRMQSRTKATQQPPVTRDFCCQRVLLELAIFDYCRQGAVSAPLSPAEKRKEKEKETHAHALKRTHEHTHTAAIAGEVVL